MKRQQEDSYMTTITTTEKWEDLVEDRIPVVCFSADREATCRGLKLLSKARPGLYENIGEEPLMIADALISQGVAIIVVRSSPYDYINPKMLEQAVIHLKNMLRTYPMTKKMVVSLRDFGFLNVRREFVKDLFTQIGENKGFDIVICDDM